MKNKQMKCENCGKESIKTKLTAMIYENEQMRVCSKCLIDLGVFE